MKTKILIEMRATADADPFGAAAGPVAGGLPGVSYDMDFGTIALPGAQERGPKDAFDLSIGLEVLDDPSAATTIMRGEVETSEIDALLARAARDPSIVGIFADVAIAPTIICPGSAPMGTDATVEKLLCTAAMARQGMDGRGVTVAVVDTGFNLAYLNGKGKHPGFDAANSWTWSAASVPGAVPVNHGTMCAFDVCIAAPRCTLLDVVLLHPVASGGGGSIMSGLLSDAVKAYKHLYSYIKTPRRPGENKSLVVTNSWGMFHPSWDYPPGHPLNYSHNINHPFCKMVALLESVGADILFAAGNCGPDCPDSRCQGLVTGGIYGANSHPAVLSVAGADVSQNRVGYSNVGPGDISRRKPDVTGYTHFAGSGVYASDGGTSAATPVVAGVVAAVRSKLPYDSGVSTTFPAAVRGLVTSTAIDKGPAGYDYLYGHGIINGCGIRRRIAPTLCERYPRLCKAPIRPKGFGTPISSASDAEPSEDGEVTAESSMPTTLSELTAVVEYLVERLDGDGSQVRSHGASADCGCGKKSLPSS